MLCKRLKQVRRLFNTGDTITDRYNQREWVRAVRLVRATKIGWIADPKPIAKEQPHV